MGGDRDLLQPPPTNLGQGGHAGPGRSGPHSNPHPNPPLPRARAHVVPRKDRDAHLAELVRSHHDDGHDVLLMSVEQPGHRVEAALRALGVDTNLCHFLDATGTGATAHGLQNPRRFATVPSPHHVELFMLRAERAARQPRRPTRVVLAHLEAMTGAVDLGTVEEFTRLLLRRFGAAPGLDILLDADHPQHASVRPVLERFAELEWA